MKNFDFGYFCVELIFQSMNLNEISFDIKIIEIIHKLKDFFFQIEEDFWEPVLFSFLRFVFKFCQIPRGNGYFDVKFWQKALFQHVH